MNSRIFFVVLLTLGGAVIFGFASKPKQELVKAESVSQTVKAEAVDSLTQTKSMGAVEVEITPTKLEVGKNMTFELSLNTHSVELNYDYTKILIAQDNNGNTYKATSWSGGESGHHLSGEVEFEPLFEEAKSIKLNVNGIDNQKEVFEWKI